MHPHRLNILCKCLLNNLNKGAKIISNFHSEILAFESIIELKIPLVQWFLKKDQNHLYISQKETKNIFYTEKEDIRQMLFFYITRIFKKMCIDAWFNEIIQHINK